MTDADNLEPWQRVAAELGTHDFERMLFEGEQSYASMEPAPDRHDGEWTRAAPACREIARLRAEVADVRQTFDSVQTDMIEKWEGLCAAIGVNPVEAQWLIESQASNIANDAAECVKLRAELQDRLDSQQRLEIAKLRAKVERMRQLLGDA